MATQLSLYNDALFHLGERKLAALTDSGEPRRVLDELYAGARSYCLEQGNWKFAQRATKMVADPSITPSWGPVNGFEKPTDYVRLSAQCYDEYFTNPVENIMEEAGFWYADVDEFYLKYVSNHTSYGYDMSRWPESFALYVSLYLAWRAAPRIAADKTAEIDTEMAKAKLNALSKDAVSGPMQRLPQGRWVTARGRINKERSRNNVNG